MRLHGQGTAARRRGSPVLRVRPCPRRTVDYVKRNAFKGIAVRKQIENEIIVREKLEADFCGAEPQKLPPRQAADAAPTKKNSPARVANTKALVILVFTSRFSFPAGDSSGLSNQEMERIGHRDRIQIKSRSTSTSASTYAPQNGTISPRNHVQPVRSFQGSRRMIRAFQPLGQEVAIVKSPTPGSGNIPKTPQESNRFFE